MKTSKATARKPPAKSKKPLAKSELDKVSGAGERFDELVQEADEREAAAAAGLRKSQ